MLNPLSFQTESSFIISTIWPYRNPNWHTTLISPGEYLKIMLSEMYQFIGVSFTCIYRGNFDFNKWRIHASDNSLRRCLLPGFFTEHIFFPFVCKSFSTLWILIAWCYNSRQTYIIGFVTGKCIQWNGEKGRQSIKETNFKTHRY